MREISVNVELENAGDRVGFEQGLYYEASIRSARVDAIVDTAAAMLVLPQNVVERLGLRTRRTTVVTYADERKEERPVAGPVTITISDRFMSTDCIVGPPMSEALVGHTVMQTLDLNADCAHHTIAPRWPDYPVLKLKGHGGSVFLARDMTDGRL